MTVRVKICCITDRGEADMAIGLGAHALGLVGRMPSGPGPIDDETITAIAGHVPPAVATFLLTSETEPDAVAAHVGRCRTNTVQIVDRVSADVYRALRDAMPHVKIVQVVHVTGTESVDEAQGVAEDVDAVLLDSGSFAGSVKELGGTGRTHDWSLSRRIVEAVTKPVFLAGGLRPDNVGDAIRAVRPYGVDLCTGVRTDGRLDADKLVAFMAAVAAA